MEQDLMIDLETLGTGSNCVIVSIGACFFDIEKRQINNNFHMILDVQEQINAGRVIDASTLKWWMGQSDAAKKIFNENSKSAKLVLSTFANWIKSTCSDSRKLKAWGNGSTFDISILESAFEDFDVKVPWTYGGVMDLRTFRRFIAKGAKVENVGVVHNALDDAISQAAFVIRYANPKEVSNVDGLSN